MTASANSWDEAIKQAPIGVFRSTAKGKIVFANQELARIFGYESAEELIEQVKDISKDLFRYPRQREELLEALMERGEIRDYVYEAKAKDKTVRFVAISARKVEDADRDIHLEGFMHDVTEKQTAENILAEIQGIAYRCKPASPWQMEWVSTGCRELTGYAKEAIEDQRPEYGDLIFDTHQKEVSKIIEAAIEKNTTFTLIYPIRTSNAEKKWVFERGRAVRDGNDHVTHLEGVIQNYNSHQNAKWYQRERQEMRLRDLNQNLYLRRAMWWAVFVVFSLANLTMLGIVLAKEIAGSLGEQTFVYCFGATVAEMAAIALLMARNLFASHEAMKPGPQKREEREIHGGAIDAGTANNRPKRTRRNSVTPRAAPAPK